MPRTATRTGGFATAGKGVVDFPHFIARLRAAGFDGDLVTHGLAAAEAPGVAAFLAKPAAHDADRLASARRPAPRRA